MKISNCFYNSFWILNFHECFHFTFLIDPVLLFSRSVGQSHGLQHCLWHHGLQHTRVPCSSPSPGVCSNSCPLSQWCHPTISSSVISFSSCLPSFPVSGSFLVALHIKWPKYWSFSFSTSPSSQYSEWITFRIDWFDLLAVQGTLKSLLQRHSSKVSILQCSAFFMVQIS